MQRRQFIKNVASLATLSLLDSGYPRTARSENSQAVHTVYVMFKCHLDVGFSASQADVLSLYFDIYLPQAMETARSFRQADQEERYVWTTGSFLIHEYLEQASPDNQKMMEDAVHAGDIAWHALPFSWQTEMFDRSLIMGAIQISKSLDRRFGMLTTGAKMTDVPGHTRGLVSPLAKNGVTFLNIGVNAGSPMPSVPNLFRWRDPDDSELIAMYFADYGGQVTVPGSGIAVRICVRGDNSGPDSPEEVRAIYADLRSQFPGAKIVAASLSTIANALQPYKANLPLITAEIGDTWIHGCASDPYKVSRYLELMRLRNSWIAAGRMSPGDANDLKWLPWLTLAAEHTWGCDVKSVLGDYDVQTPADLLASLGKPNFLKVVSTWNEKRSNIDKAVSLLPSDLAEEATTNLAALRAVPPSIAGFIPALTDTLLQTKHFQVQFDPATGGIIGLKRHKSGRQWASATNPIGDFLYQTFNAADCDRFVGQYCVLQQDWVAKDFGKPGADHYQLLSKTWSPQLYSLLIKRDKDSVKAVVNLVMPATDPSMISLVGWPENISIEYNFPNHAPNVEIALSWFNKKANRLPEALWFSFMPVVTNSGKWTIYKSDEACAPFDIVPNGNRHLHAALGPIKYVDASGEFTLETLDAPVVAPGQRSLLNFNNDQPDMSGGVHVNLFNNTWGTNYVQWFGEDARFRFTLTL